MLGTTRQLRARVQKVSESGVPAPANDAPKRRVLGDISNRASNVADDEGKPAAKSYPSEAPSNKGRTTRSRKAPVPVNPIRKILSHIGSSTNPTGKSKRASKGADISFSVETVNLVAKKGLKIVRSTLKKTDGDHPSGGHRSANADTGEMQTEVKRRTRSSSRSRPDEMIVEPEISMSGKRSKRSGTNEAGEPASKRRRPAPIEASQAIAAKASNSHNGVESKTTGHRGRGRSNTAGQVASKESKPQPRELCSDFYVDSNYTLVHPSFDPAKYNAGISKHDVGMKNDSLEVADYVTDMYQHFYQAETAYRPRMYMADQDEINAMMRAILVDWLVEVHMKFKLVPETLYLSISIIDRYCSRVEVERRKLQLVGVTALLLACKYEEIYPPEVRDCVYITDRAYTRQDVLDMEQTIVKALEFKLTVPTGYPFLVRYLRITKASELAVAAANYYMESTLQVYEFVQYRASLVASAAVCLAWNHPRVRREELEIGKRPGVIDDLLEYTGYTKDEIFAVACKIAEKIGAKVVTASQRALLAVKKKYDSGKFFHVSIDDIDPVIADLL